MASTSYSQLNSSTRSTLHGSKRRQTIFISIIRYIKEAWKEGLVDLSTGWPFIFLFLWLAGLVTTLIILGVFLNPPASACRPDGTFSPFTGYSYWDASGFFQITLAFGNFTFTQVKVIDTAWDIGVGRIGQGILAYFSWRTFADYATLSMETTPITYTTFIILFIERGPEFTSFCQLLRDFVLYRRLGSKISTAWVIFSMFFVLAWPTFIASASGYTPQTGPYVVDINENFVPYNEFRLLAYIIHDGSRINLTDDYPVPLGIRPYETSGTGLHMSTLNILNLIKSNDATENILLSSSNHFPLPYEFYASYECDEFPLGGEDATLCYLAANISEYVLKYGFNGQSRDASQWLNYTLPRNSLDIEPFVKFTKNVHESPEITWFQPTWAYSSRNYTLSEIQSNGTCKTLGESFQWGFSYLQIFIAVLSLTAWTSGTCLLSYQTNRFPPLQGQPERPRGLRALILLADAVRSELEASEINPHSLTDKQLKRHISKRLKGGSTFFGFPIRKKNTRSRSVLQLVKEDSWETIGSERVIDIA
ncbi:hypothetical protein F5Y12DRAFT_718434 [Xylaria sp. FL1777]|nr:hypothetical protein F5Y12DRAFT_718434 [Xylaria sp. FL1777]